MPPWNSASISTTSPPCGRRVTATMPEAHNVEPDLVAAAGFCERAGAHGITVHLRADRRHIQDRDVSACARASSPSSTSRWATPRRSSPSRSASFPEDVCIVPENRREITTEGGLDAVASFTPLEPTVRRLQSAGIRVSLFIEPDPEQIEAAPRLRADAIELHTGAFANAKATTAGRTQAPHRRRPVATPSASGQRRPRHQLHQYRPVLAIPHLAELNIGHSIICRALFTGLETAVREMVEALRHYPGSDDLL